MKRVFYVDSERVWTFKLVKSGDITTLMEIHLGSTPDDDPPKVIIPDESLADLIKALQYIEKHRSKS